MTQKFRVLLNCISVHTHYESLRSYVIMFCVRSQGNKICQRCLCPQLYCSLISNNTKGEGKKGDIRFVKGSIDPRSFFILQLQLWFYLLSLYSSTLAIHLTLYFSLCLNSIIFPSASVIALPLSLLHLTF